MILDRAKGQSVISRYPPAVLSIVKSEWLRHAGIGLLAVVVAFLARQWLIPLLDPGLVYITFHLAVTVAAVFGGFRSGLLATALSALFSFYFILTPGPLGEPQVLGIAMFCLNGVIISAVADLYRQARNRTIGYERERVRLEAEQRVADIVENITDGFHLIDRQWRFVYFNDAAKKLLVAQGMNPEALLGKHIFDEAFPEVAENEAGRALRRSMTERVPAEAEDYYEPWQRWFAVRCFPTPEGGVYSFFQDITERKRAEEALRNSQDALNALNAQLSADLTAMTSMQELSTRLVQAGDISTLLHGILDAAMEITRADMGNVQLLEQGVLKIIVQRGFQAPFLDFFNQVHNGQASACGAAMHSAERVIIEDVENSPIFAAPAVADVMRAANVRAVQSTPLISRSGQLVGMFSTHYHAAPRRPSAREFRLLDILARQAADLIERNRTEEKLRESEQRLQGILRQATVGIAQTDLTGRFVLVNDRFCEIAGRPREELLRLRMQDITCRDELEKNLVLFQQTAQTGEDFVIEKRYVRPDGSLVWVHNSVYAVRGSDGQPAHIVAVSVDINDRKKAEEERQRLIEELETRVAERTAELRQVNEILMKDIQERQKLHEQLLQAQKLESVGTLAGGIAHDFNNILNIIQGYSFILRGHANENREIGQSLKVIDETIQRGSALVQQLLAVARKTEVKLDAIDINRLIEGLIALVKQTFPKTIEVNAHFAPRLPSIRADGNQFGQALLNLALNARDAMPDGGSLVFKTTTVNGGSLQELAERAAEDYVCIEVSDTGLGMDDTVQHRIFEPFFTTKKLGHGTGLGLSVVYGIVQSHNGIIRVESKPMSGTTFRLYLPVDPSAAIPPGEPAQAERLQSSERLDGSATILVVEDEKRMLYLLEKTLRQQGYAVLMASDGQIALDIYEREKDKIDAVLLDLGLPKLAGRDVALKIKETNPNVKLVVTSGYLDPELKSAINQSGVQHFLNKPYLPEDLIKTLQVVLKN